VDTARGLAMTGGSARQYQEVLALYVEDAVKRLELLREAPDRDGLALFTIQVHALKSASASIGAAALSEMAAELEAAGKRGDLALIRERLNVFREDLASLASRIRAALSSAKERRKTDRRRSSDRREGNERRSGSERRRFAETDTADKDLLLLLKAALVKEAVSAADDAIEKLLKRETGTKTKEALSRAANCVLISDFQGAVKIVDELLRGTKPN
jgi:HPt (histidine-containing phosphotransfer) domain-containing protein